MSDIQKLRDEIEALRKSHYEQLDEINDMRHNRKEDKEEIEALRKECVDKTECLEDLHQWAKAYPVKVFREPDYKRAATALEAAGMTLDGLSASTCRVVLGDMIKRLESQLKKEIGK